MDINLFDYHLPESLIAQTPAARRQDAKLLQRSRDGQITRHTIEDLVQLIPENSLLVLNNSRVFPARVQTHLSTGGKIEIFFTEFVSEDDNSSTWKIFAKPLKKIKKLGSLDLAENIRLTVTADHQDHVECSLNLNHHSTLTWLEDVGEIPLPPYIKRNSSENFDQQKQDRERYQTVYAGPTGSVAAPTAGLHFTEDLFKSLEARNIEIAETCLHVGAGTFLPIKTQDILAHHMHKESYMMPAASWNKILAHKNRGSEIIAVGTTSMRLLESFAKHIGGISAAGDYNSYCDKFLSTNLYIHPQENDILYQPEIPTALMTNFHLPKSSLFVLVSSLIGIDNTQAMYKWAVENRFRFFSYGDSSLLWL